MGHVRDGTLRRLYDERAAVPLSARRHLIGCRRCQERYAAIVAEAQGIAVLFGAAPREEPRPGGALHRMPRRGHEHMTHRDAPAPEGSPLGSAARSPERAASTVADSDP